MRETKFLFDKMKKLYPSFEMPDEVDVMAWTEILDGYSQVDILNALKNYRKVVAYNNAPNPATFKNYLPARHYSVEEAKPEVAVIRGDEAITRMSDDIASGNCRHNLYVYKDALSIVLNEWLKDKIPVSEWAQVTEGTRIKLAYENGLFDGFDDALKLACQRKFGRDFEFSSKNDMMN